MLHVFEARSEVKLNQRNVVIFSRRTHIGGGRFLSFFIFILYLSTCEGLFPNLFSQVYFAFRTVCSRLWNKFFPIRWNYLVEGLQERGVHPLYSPRQNLCTLWMTVITKNKIFWLCNLHKQCFMLRTFNEPHPSG